MTQIYRQNLSIHDPVSQKLLTKSIYTNIYLKTRGERLKHWRSMTLLTQRQLAEALGIKQATLSQLENGIAEVNRRHIDKIDEIYKVGPKTREWIWSGGEEPDLPDFVVKEKKTIELHVESPGASYERKKEGIPLYPSYAHAGQLVGFADDDYSELPRFSVPGFADCDVLVPVAGDSMYPEYTAGDIIACRRIWEPTFIQWGHAYLIETPQGLLLKNLEPDENSENKVYMVSVNPKFKPILILKIELKKLWIVKGKIKRNLL